MYICNYVHVHVRNCVTHYVICSEAQPVWNEVGVQMDYMYEDDLHANCTGSCTCTCIVKSS